MPEAIRIRAARPDDSRAVRALCARVWSDDYIPGVFDEWVRDRRGRLWVAVADGQVAGVAKLTLLGDHEAWLHALRVDPRFRRQGIAGALFEHRLARAERLGARVARLDTSEDNVAVRRLARRHGFRVLARQQYREAPARDVTPPRRGERAELETLWSLARRGDGLLHLAYTVRRLTKADLAKAISGGHCLAAGSDGHPTAVAIIEPHRSTPGERGPRSRLAIRAIGGSSRGCAELLASARGLARPERVRSVGIRAPSRLWPALRSSGYRMPWRGTGLLYERSM